MANDPAKKDDVKKGKAPSRGMSKAGIVMITILFSGSLLFWMPIFIMVMAGLIPTFVALLTDDDKDRSSSIAIGSLNCVGILPFVIDLVTKGLSIGNAFMIMSQMTTWVVILGAAAMGKLIMFAVPQATAALTLVNAEYRLKLLNENLKSLKAAWGEDVATTKSLDSLKQER